MTSLLAEHEDANEDIVKAKEKEENKEKTSTPSEDKEENNE